MVIADSTTIIFLINNTAWKVPIFGVILVRILRISPYSVRMRENVNQNNSEYGHFLRSVNNSRH